MALYIRHYSKISYVFHSNSTFSVAQVLNSYFAQTIRNIAWSFPSLLPNDLSVFVKGDEEVCESM